jgi:DNA repair photolyase
MVEEPEAIPVFMRLLALRAAKSRGIKTFVSCEPVIDAEFIYYLIRYIDYIDEFRIGKMNYRPSDIDWKVFGTTCERLCKHYRRNYMIKEGLRKCMED